MFPRGNKTRAGAKPVALSSHNVGSDVVGDSNLNFGIHSKKPQGAAGWIQTLISQRFCYLFLIVHLWDIHLSLLLLRYLDANKSISQVLTKKAFAISVLPESLIQDPGEKK